MIMKNKKNSFGKMLLLFTLTVSTVIFGQNLKSITSQKNEAAHEISSPCELMSFTVKTVEGKNYINWLAKSSSNDYYFLLEKSFDGEEYLRIYIAKNSISPADQKLQYSFVDEEITNSKKTYYRITLHKIEAIDTKSKLIVLSSENVFEMNNNASVLVVEPTADAIAQYSK